MDRPLRIAFVGSIVPDEEGYRSAALSRAGLTFQTSLLKGLAQGGLRPDVIVSGPPVARFPTFRKIWLSGRHIQLDPALKVWIAPLLNIAVLKNVFFGVLCVLAMARWALTVPGPVRRVIVVYNLTFPPSVFILLAARLIKAKAVAIVNDLNVPGEDRVPSNLLRRIEYRLQLWSIPHFDALVCCNDEIANRHGRGLPCVVIEGGIESGFTVHSSSGIAPEQSAFTVMYAGRLSRQHGTDLLLDAWRAVKGDCWRLIVAGQGPLQQAVEEAAARDQTIVYAGYLPREEILPLYSVADVLVSLWRTDSAGSNNFFPSKLMEYLATGKPVISTCAGHTAKEYGHLCFLLREETAAALVNVLREISGMPCERRSELGRRARTYIMRHKTWAAHAERVIELLDSL